MWLFSGVSSATQSRHMRQVKQALSASQHGCRSVSLSPGEQAASLPHRGFGCPHLWELVRQRAEAEICQAHSPALCPQSCSSACPLREVGGGMQSVPVGCFWGRKQRGWHNGEAPGLFCLTCQMCMLWSCCGFAMEKRFLLLIQFLDSLRLGLVWQKIILQQILLAWVRSDGVSVARQGQDLNPLFVHSQEFSHSLNGNDTNLVWYPLPVPLGDEVTT